MGLVFSQTPGIAEGITALSARVPVSEGLLSPEGKNINVMVSVNQFEPYTCEAFTVGLIGSICQVKNIVGHAQATRRPISVAGRLDRLVGALPDDQRTPGEN